MKAQKRVPYILALPLFIIASVVMQFSGIGIGNASAATLTWDGSAGDGKFSTGANWNTGNAPVNGDVLNFNLTSVGSVHTFNNDISGLSVAGINISGEQSIFLDPAITGNALTLTGNITNTATYNSGPLQISINSGVILGANIALSGPISFNGSTGKTTHLGSYNMSITNTAGTCQTNLGALSGSGAVSLAGISGGPMDHKTNYVLSNNSGFTGAISINSGVLYVVGPASLGNASGLTVSGSGTLSLFSSEDSTWSVPLTLGGSGAIAAQQNGQGGCGGGGGGDIVTATITSPVTLTSNFVYNGGDNLNITGDYQSNGYTFAVQSGVSGTLTTPEGEASSPVTETEFTGDQPNDAVNIQFNQTGILSGTRGDIGVHGGLLKGTGTARSLSISSGLVSPGNSPGTLTVLESYTQFGGAYRAEILNKDSYDKLVIGANYSDSYSAISLDVDEAALDLVLYDGWKINAGDKFTIIDNQSSTAIQGNFKDLAEGTEFVSGGIRFTISYVGGDGNDVVVTALTSGVGAPNTGIQKLITGNPVIVAGLGILAAATILFVAVRRKSVR